MIPAMKLHSLKVNRQTMSARLDQMKTRRRREIVAVMSQEGRRPGVLRVDLQVSLLIPEAVCFEALSDLFKETPKPPLSGPLRC